MLNCGGGAFPSLPVPWPVWRPPICHVVPYTADARVNASPTSSVPPSDSSARVAKTMARRRLTENRIPSRAWYVVYKSISNKISSIAVSSLLYRRRYLQFFLHLIKLIIHITASVIRLSITTFTVVCISSPDSMCDAAIVFHLYSAFIMTLTLGVAIWKLIDFGSVLGRRRKQ